MFSPRLLRLILVLLVLAGLRPALAADSTSATISDANAICTALVARLKAILPAQIAAAATPDAFNAITQTIDQAKTSCTNLASSVSQLKALEQLAVEQAICARKAREIDGFITAYYDLGTSGGGGGSGTTTKPRARDPIASLAFDRLTIESATFGDETHGHTCDATPYFWRKCKTGAVADLSGLPETARKATSETPAAASEEQQTTENDVGDSYCFVTRSSPTATDLCGFDPSPFVDLSEKTIRIRTTCGGEAQRDVTVPGNASRVSLICRYPMAAKPPATQPDDTNAKLDDQLAFFNADPCKTTLPKRTAK